MDSKHVLVVYFSRSGNTRTVAQVLRSMLGCAIERIVDERNLRGPIGYLRCLADIVAERAARLRPMTIDPASYDLVVVGTPVWSASVSTPVRTYLSENAARLRKVAFFCTYGGSGGERAFTQMAAACGQAPVATFALASSNVDEATLTPKLQPFVTSLVSALDETASPAVPPVEAAPAFI